jgi:hypothetical protein
VGCNSLYRAGDMYSKVPIVDMQKWTIEGCVYACIDTYEVFLYDRELYSIPGMKPTWDCSSDHTIYQV